MQEYNFYSVIIGTELLNGRRQDAHFSFFNSQLLKRGWTHKASFVIKDDPKFMEEVYSLIKNDSNSVMFSFGGIGATPDDYTRECAANVFTNGKMEENTSAKKAILDRFKEQAYPNRIKMAYLPINASLLHNPITNVPGFYLQNRFFFVPGFVNMAQPMIIEALDKHYKQNPYKKYAQVMSIWASENDLISTMKTISNKVDLSSLPIIEEDKRYVVISISGYDKDIVLTEFNKFINFCNTHNLKYELKDIRQI